MIFKIILKCLLCHNLSNLNGRISEISSSLYSTKRLECHWLVRTMYFVLISRRNNSSTIHFRLSSLFHYYRKKKKKRKEKMCFINKLSMLFWAKSLWQKHETKGKYSYLCLIEIILHLVHFVKSESNFLFIIIFFAGALRLTSWKGFWKEEVLPVFQTTQKRNLERYHDIFPRYSPRIPETQNWMEGFRKKKQVLPVEKRDLEGYHDIFPRYSPRTPEFKNWTEGYCVFSTRIGV